MSERGFIGSKSFCLGLAFQACVILVGCQLPGGASNDLGNELGSSDPGAGSSTSASTSVPQSSDAASTTSSSSNGASSASSTARSFQVRDGYSISRGFYSNGAAVARDASGNLYVAGMSWDSASGPAWVVRKSSDSGATWSIADFYQYSGGTAGAQAIAVAPNGKIYVGGWAAHTHNGGNDAMYSVIRMSADRGATWSNVECVSLSSFNGQSSGVAALVVDTSGAVFAAGGNNGWFVKKSADEGATWSVVDTYSSGVSSNSGATAMTSDPSGNLYVVGNAVDSTGAWIWTVRKGVNSGSSWSTVDSYVYGSGYYAYPKAVVADSSGNIYAAGFEGIFVRNTYYPSSNWVVRKWTSTQGAWATVGASNRAAGQTGTSANGVAVDASGNVYVVGSDETSHWMVNRSTDGGASWQAIDSQWGSASAAVAAGGLVVVTGSGTWAGMSSAWIARSLGL